MRILEDVSAVSFVIDFFLSAGCFSFRCFLIASVMSVFHVHEEGWTKISMDDVEGLHWKYEAEVRHGNAI